MALIMKRLSGLEGHNEHKRGKKTVAAAVIDGSRNRGSTLDILFSKTLWVNVANQDFER